MKNLTNKGIKMKTEHITIIMNLIENAELAETARTWEEVITSFLVVFMIAVILISIRTPKIEWILSTIASVCLLALMAIIMSSTPTKETLYKEAYIYLVNQRENMSTNDYEKIEQIIIQELNNNIRNQQ